MGKNFLMQVHDRQKLFVMNAQRNCLNETVPLSIQGMD